MNRDEKPKCPRCGSNKATFITSYFELEQGHPIIETRFLEYKCSMCLCLWHERIREQAKYPQPTPQSIPTGAATVCCSTHPEDQVVHSNSCPNCQRLQAENQRLQAIVDELPCEIEAAFFEGFQAGKGAEFRQDCYAKSRAREAAEAAK